MEHLHRRSLLKSAAAFLAAPAIVRASSIMPVKAWDETHFYLVDARLGPPQLKTEGGDIDWDYNQPKYAWYEVGFDIYGKPHATQIEMPASFRTV